jgi:hypothetical protein
MPEDFAELLAELSADPKASEPLGRDCHKVRMSIFDKERDELLRENGLL